MLGEINMIVTTWTKWRNALGLGNVQARRRIAKPRGNWGIETERMEGRALLSAVGGLAPEAPVAAEVATETPRASFAYPNVAGQWHVAGEGIEGDVTMTQTKAKVTSDISIMGISVHMKGKFTKAHPTELSGSTKVVNPMGGGKVKVDVHIQFGQGSNPTTFTGEVTVPSLGVTINLTGSKTSPASAALSEKAAPMYPDISGAWDASAEVTGFGLFQGTLNVSQTKGKIQANADLGDGIAISLKGKINKQELTHIKGKANITTPIAGFTKVKAPFELDLTANNTHFTGVAHTKIGDIPLDGVKQ